MKNKPHIDDLVRVLIVEGWSDLHFYAEALEYLGLHQDIYIHDCGGIENLKKKLRALLTPELLAEKRSIALILDADSGAASQIQSVRDRLQRMEGLLGRTFVDNGWSKGQPDIGFFVVPDGQGEGEVETLAWRAWAGAPENASLRACVEQYFECVQQHRGTLKKPDKIRINSVLSVENVDDPRLGPGAQANIFDFSRPEFEPLLNFLRGFAG